MIEAQWEQQTERLVKATSFSALVPGLFAGFTTRHGGVSAPPYDTLNLGFHVGDDIQAVQKNRELIANDSDFPLTDWVGSEQVHGANITEITKKDAGKGATSLETAISKTDGLYTKENGLLLTSLYADCVPLYFVAKNEGYIGLCHAGWQGTVKKIGPKLVDIWTMKHKISLSEIHVLIGPCISKEQYEVNELVIEQVECALPNMKEKPYEPSRPGHFFLDLTRLNYMLLLEAGVPLAHIHTSRSCTFNDDRYFSHRQAKEMTGRMMSAIGLKKGEY